MGDTDRRRTGFERDLREFVLKLVFGLVIGFVLSVLITTPVAWWIPYAMGIGLVFVFAWMIRGSSRHQDDR